MKSHAQVVVIGGGVTGCSVLYHLAKMGWTDVVLIERKELTSGSSWHAAGGLFALTSPSNVAALQKYTIELYPEIEKESGQPVGFHLTGGFHLARTQEQVTALKGQIPLGTLGMPADIAGAALFLVGPDARYITGQVLSVDGGMAQYGWVWPNGKPDYFKE